MSDGGRAWPSRAPLVALALLLATLGVVETVPFLPTVPAAVLLLVALARTRVARSRPESDRIGLLAAAAALIPFVFGQFLMVSAFTDRPGLAVVLGVLTGLTAIGAVVLPRLFGVHLAACAGMHTFYVSGLDADIDVGYFVRDSTAALLEGRNPYGMTFPNPYPPAEVVKYWAPQFIDGDRITIGFPYLPGALIGYLPGQLVGEVRVMSVAAVLMATVLAWRMASEPVGRLLVVGLPLTPLALLVTMNYWVEPMVLLAVVGLAFAFRRNSRAWGLAALVLLLTAKQYAVLWLPLERLVRRRLGVRTLWIGAGIAAAVVLVAFVASPGDFWRSVVQAQFVQPFRSDSISLAADLVDAGVPVPKVVLSIGSLLAGLGAAMWVRATAPDTATWLVLGIGLSLLATVLLSKQAFTNYYFLVHACVVVGVALWPSELGEEPAAPDTRAA